MTREDDALDSGRTGEEVAAAAETIRHRPLSPFWRTVLVVFAVIAVLLSVNQIFNFGFGIRYVILDNQYLYLLTALLLPPVFLIFPIREAARQTPVPAYDVVLFLAAFSTGLYFAWFGEKSIEQGWEYAAPDHAHWVGYLFWALVLEATRRAGGLALTIIVLLFSLYPPLADKVPGPIQGFPQSFWDVPSFYAFSSEASFGIPMNAFGKLVIGFLVFGVALQITGAGRFFIDLALALLGHTRGGAAKVSIFSSGLLGSMSGSVITNVLTTGTLTIPAMKRTGFSARYAAGVEACASTGGVLMPPVMGATAFVMSTFLEVEYVAVVIAAIVPSLLYYLGLFLQIDAHAAWHGLKGMDRSRLPKVFAVLMSGWYYLFALVLLVWMLLVLKREAMAPFYATLMLLAANQLFGQRLGWKDILTFMHDLSKVLVELTAILLGIGLIIGALVVTGLAGTVATDLILLAGGNVYVLLVMGAITSFILGMGMTVTAAYIFLAIVLAPALVNAGLDPMAAHLFILYWGMLSFITPPVALGAFAAATLAGAKPMEAGFAAMRLGSIIYVIPFFFVLNPALILKGGVGEIVVVIGTAVVGVFLIAAAAQAYLAGVGRLDQSILGQIARLIILIAGLAFAFPGSDEMGVSHIEASGIALAVGLAGVALAFMGRRAPA
jgi:TRAP transporter 4TM/12TM fusion protein